MEITPRQFELTIENHMVRAEYRLEGTELHIDYVESPPKLRGTGAAGKLMRNIADYATKQEFHISPHCGYAAAWLRKHKEFHSLTAKA